MAVYLVEELVRRQNWLDGKDAILTDMRRKVAAKMMKTGALEIGAELDHSAEVTTITFCRAGTSGRYFGAPVERATHAHVRLEVLVGDPEEDQ